MNRTLEQIHVALTVNPVVRASGIVSRPPLTPKRLEEIRALADEQQDQLIRTALFQLLSEVEDNRERNKIV